MNALKIDLMTSLFHHLANFHKFYYIFLKKIRNYLSLPDFESISFKMADLIEGGGGGVRISHQCVHCVHCVHHLFVIQKTPC